MNIIKLNTVILNNSPLNNNNENPIDIQRGQGSTPSAFVDTCISQGVWVNNNRWSNYREWCNL